MNAYSYQGHYVCHGCFVKEVYRSEVRVDEQEYHRTE